jgi:radical SAM superfamily enzyme YgiQ (UPF0313 family)
MKLTLVKPNLGRLDHSLYVDEGRMEPLQLGLLAGLTPPDVEISLHDDRCETIDYDQPTDLVAITVETFTARRAYEISAEFRRRGRRVVMGGFHPTLLPDEAGQHADAIVVGDAEPVWKTVIADAQAGRLQPRYCAAPETRWVVQNNHVPNRKLFRGKGYLPVTLTQFGRGCPHGCEFCAVSAFFGRQHRFRPVAEVVRELESQNRRLVFFVDDNIVADHAAAKALFRALIPLRLRWVSQGCIDMVHDRELMDVMTESGCLGHVIGFESIEAATLVGMHKRNNVGARFTGYAKEIAILREYGLQTWAAFTLGHDQDTPESLWRLYDFAMAHQFTFAAFNVLMPYPNTPLYARLLAENRLLYDGCWWLHPEYRFNHAAFLPRRMSPDELTQTAFDIRARWNRPMAMARRFLEPRTNLRSLYRMAIFWLYNPLFRRETFKKQGMRLGQDGTPRRITQPPAS